MDVVYTVRQSTIAVAERWPPGPKKGAVVEKWLLVLVQLKFVRDWVLVYLTLKLELEISIN